MLHENGHTQGVPKQLSSRLNLSIVSKKKMVLLLTDKALFYCFINQEIILDNLTSEMELTTNLSIYEKHIKEKVTKMVYKYKPLCSSSFVQP